jgi:asparagine synthase (glutamine-hydrolysing)
MIAALLDLERGSQDGAGFARLLEFGATPKSHWQAGEGHLLAQLGANEAGIFEAGRWSPGRSASGRLVLFNGQFHNRLAIAALLAAPRRDDATLYAMALDRWGEAVDDKIIGNYCAIVLAPDGQSLRLSRSPLLAPPLHFRHEARRAIASSIPRHLFWHTAAPRRINLEQLARSTLIDFSDRFAGWYQGCGRVPLGCAIQLTPTGFEESWRYDLFSRPKIRFPRDQDYVEAAGALLDEGVAAALAGSRRPGIFLSGGLDSSQVALSALRLTPPEQDLLAFTYGPEAGWTGAAPPGRYPNEFAAVASLAAAHPRLKPEFFTNDDQDFRQGMRELQAAMDCAPPALGLGWMQHDLYERARARGCDVLLTGDWGNLTFSTTAPWAAAEFFRRGRWLKLWQALRHEPLDHRPMWRRFVARVVMPQLPRSLWRRGYSWWHGAAPDPIGRSGLAPEWAVKHRLVERAQAAGLDLERLQTSSRRAFWQRLLTEDGQGHDQFTQGMQQLYGIPMRDPAAYRPLVEFCYGIPTEQFTRGPMNRYLARRMAAGRLPEDLRLNRDLGLHYADWHLRIGRVRGELIDELDRMAQDEDIAALIDLPGLRRLLVDFPAAQDVDDAAGDPYKSALPLGIAAGRFIAYAKGRNDI